MTKSALDTPMMRQFLSVKEQHPDCIVFYRMGDFYEMFLDDAVLVAPLLDITLTTRDKNKVDPVPMCGIPVHAADQYLQKLASLGHRIAICEQVENPAEAGGKRLVKREVVEVVTPGLVGDPDALPGGHELALVALLPGTFSGMAVLDASTGDLRCTEVEGDGIPLVLQDELRRIDPREVLLPEGEDEVRSVVEGLLPRAAITSVSKASFEAGSAPVEPHGFDPAGLDAATRSTTALLGYVGAQQPFALTQISRLRRYTLNDAMMLDEATRGHLELFRNSEDGGRAGTLIERLDQTSTALGARRLARWLAYPLVEPEAVVERQGAVAYLVERDRPRSRLREVLRPIRDLERLLAKSARPTATPRDLAALRGSLEALPHVGPALEADADGLLETDVRPTLLEAPQPITAASDLLRIALVDEPPALPRGSRGAHETGFIREGYHSELDGVREAVTKGREWIAGLEREERERTGLSNLKIRFHPVHGYSVEVSKANADRVPGDYERKQTLANVERYTMPKLRDIERQVLGANERVVALERELFEGVRLEVLTHASTIREAAEVVSQLDAIASLAEVARRDGWVRPVVDASERLSIRGGRHPVVEPLLIARGSEEFVPNDADLDPSTRQVLILTGPNMSGKSTYLRQVALVVLLAQVGSFVPAESAEIGIVDRVFTRVGASDRLARGESTFMVEMRETAQILSQASRRSLIILDEIGRGTSTFDGLSIAWAVAEYLHDTPGLGSRTLFATHYHELTELSRSKSRVANAHFEVREWGDDVIFLRRLVEGGASRSYGIQVARLAGLPGDVISRAKEILSDLESESQDSGSHARTGESSPATSPDPQLALFQPSRPRGEDHVLAALRELDPNQTTPLEALTLLNELHDRLTRGENT
jgi:DNA mismatch repair protein MutS